MISGFGRIPNPIWPEDATTGGGRDGMGAGIRCQIRSFMAAANFGPREHLDYDQIDFKIRSKTVKGYAKTERNILTI